MVIERAESALAVKQVKMALQAEKTFEMDPRMPDDVMKICKDEIQRMAQASSDTPLKSIYIGKSDLCVPTR